MTTYKRGDVLLVNFPYTDLSCVVKRPALVVQNEKIKTGFAQWIVVQITCNTDRTGESRVRVDQDTPEGRQMNLQDDSMIVADKIVTLDAREINRKMGDCPIMAKVDEALKKILGL